MISNIFKPKKQQLLQEGQQNITLGKLVKFSHYETIFKYSFFAVLFIISLYSLDVIQFQQFLKEKNLRRFDWYDVKWMIIGLILIHITKEFNRYLVYDYVSRSLDKKYVGLDRQLRVQKIVKWIYDIVILQNLTLFFSSKQFVPYKIIDINYLPIISDHILLN